MEVASPAFTASRIAELLGVDRKTVRAQLESVTCAATVTVKGQEAKAWVIDDMPEPLRARIESTARNLGFGDARAFLEKGRVRWQPAIPIGKIAAHHADRARKRAAVLAPVIVANRNAAVAIIADGAAQAWSAAGNKETHPRTVRRWVERAIERDRGYEDWGRWAIYLDDELSAAPADPRAAAVAYDLPKLEAAISGLADPCRLSAADREKIWVQCMIDADAIATRVDESCARKTILTAIRAAQLPISQNFDEALRVAYRRKRAEWLKCGGVPSALQDKRKERNSERRWELPLSDKLTLLRYYRNCSDLASAWRLARDNGVLSAETRERYKSDPADKSYVPRNVREALATDIELIDMRKIGPRAAKLAGGWIERDHSGYEPGDWWQGDDLTPPIYFWDETETKPVLLRGQILMMIDVRTTCILGWVLIAARNYTARHIRALITHCHDGHGLPRNGFYFERGIWEKARILKGNADDSLVSLDEMELGLREFGLHFEHANTPRAKIVERVFAALQDTMEHLPGYCGRDERRDCPEKTRRAILDVNAGRCHPNDHFMHKEEWAAQFEKIVGRYNAEKHSLRGKMIPGLSPASAYATRSTGDIVRLSAETRHLLANHRLLRHVGRQGIRLPKSLGGALYRGEGTGSVIGRDVLAWVDPERLETITITDLQQKNPRIIDRADALSAFAEHPDQIRTATRQLAAHNRYGADIFRVVSAGEKPAAFRPVVMDRDTAALGTEMQRQADQRKAETQAVNRARTEINQATQRLGVTALPAAKDHRQLAEQADALRKFQEALREGEKESHE